MTKSPFRSLPSLDQLDLIIFDLGGVLLNIDYALTQTAFAKLGVEDVAQMYSQAAQSSLFDKLETGSISPAEFRDGMRGQVGVNLADGVIDDAWNALIQDLPAHRLRAVMQIRERLRTCMLSNTNVIHVQCFEGTIQKQGMMEEYQEAFEQIFYSSAIGKRKPNASAFEHVLTEMGCLAERTLFFDDSIQHLQAAHALGIHSYHLQVGAEDISDLLRRLTDGLT